MTVRSPVPRVAADAAWTPERYQGVVYLKLLAREHALEWIYFYSSVSGP